MTIINRASLRSVEFGVTSIEDVVDAPTIGTATAGTQQATVSFTAAATGGAATTFTAISTPGSITGSSATSPITVTGLTGETSYTFKVYGANASGTWSAVQSAASNSVTPTSPVPSFESIATATGDNSTSLITFSSIPSTYQHLQIRMITRGAPIGAGTTGNDNVYIRYNGDTGANYAFHTLYAVSNTLEVGSSSSFNNTWLVSGKLGNENVNNIYGANIVDIFDYANTNKFKTQRVFGAIELNGVQNANMYIASGLWRNTNAITSISIRNGDGGPWGTGSHFALYGIKGS